MKDTDYKAASFLLVDGGHTLHAIIQKSDLTTTSIKLFSGQYQWGQANYVGYIHQWEVKGYKA